MPKLDFVPSEHEVVGFFIKYENGILLTADLLKQRELMMALLRPWNGACWRCGHWLKYVVVTRHESGEHRALGEDCAEHLLESDHEYVLTLLKEADARARGEQRNREYRESFKATEPEIYDMLRDANSNPKDHLDFVVDVARRFFSDKPHLSDKQVDALSRCLAGRKKFEAQREKQKAERPATAIVPVGKGTEIVGEVVKVDVKENDFGFRRVMTVKTKEGWLVWGTVPTAISAVEVGNWIKFVANTEASDRDEAFGFFQRPRKAEVLKGEPEAPVTECVDCGASLEDVYHNDRCPECREVPF